MLDIVETLTRDGLLTAPAAQRTRDLIARGKPLDEALRQVDGLPEDRLLRTLGTLLEMPYTSWKG